MQTMTKKMAREFFKRLEGPEGCNFRKEGKEPAWNCGKGNDPHGRSKALLRKMGMSKVVIEEFLVMCRMYGGYCDCEIIFNAINRTLRSLPRTVLARR